MKRTFTISIALTLILALSPLGCKKKTAVNKDGQKDGQDVSLKDDLSTPKATIESLARHLNSAGEKVKKVFGGPKRSELYSSAITPEYKKEMEDQEKNQQGSFSMSRDIHKFDKVEKEDGQTASVLGKVEKIKTRDGKEIKSESPAKFELKKVGDKWLASSWQGACSRCKATGNCSQCDGTGTTKEKDCNICKGTGKRKGKKCVFCSGSGKSKPRKCYSCKKTKGKCRSCNGKKWKDKLKMSGFGFFLIPIVEKDKFEDFSTPENAVKSYIDIQDQKGIQGAKVAKEILDAIKKIHHTFFTKDIVDKFDESLKKAQEKMNAKKVDTKKEFKKIKEDGEWAAVKVTITRGKNKYNRYYRLKKIGSDWKVDNIGSSEKKASSKR